MLIRIKKAQSTLEYALIISVVVGALLAMQVYVKRGIQGRLKKAADDLGDQYSPGHTTGSIAVTVNTNSSENLSSGVSMTSSNSNQHRTESSDTADYTEENW